MEMNPAPLNIVISSNERYMPGATVALASVAVNARAETPLRFHVFTEDVRRESFAFLEKTILRLHPKSVVEQHVCGESILAGLPLYSGSRMAWVRCFFSRLLKDVDWALYLDCDILYLASPEEHFSYADDSVFACVVRDMSAPPREWDCAWAKSECGVDLDAERYFNSGVMLFNFKKFREEGLPEKIAAFVKEHPDAKFADQTAMNVLFNGKGLKFLPERFDWLQIFLNDEILATRPVVHYVCGAPWLPRIGAVANGRFRLWHEFADRYVWGERGRSCRNLFPRRVVLAKTVCHALLRPAIIGPCFAYVMHIAGRVNDPKNWRWTHTSSDCTRAMTRKVVMECGGKD